MCCFPKKYFFSLPMTMQSISTTFVTPTPTAPPTIPPKSKCAKRARALSADQACSGGTNLGEVMANRSAIMNTARISQLHSYFCSSQRCFNKYVKTFSDCTVDLSGSRENATAKKLVSLHARTLGLISS